MAANLGRRMLRESPFPPDATLTDEQWDEVWRYNGVELAHTWALLERMAPELRAPAALSGDLGQDLRSIPNAAVTERVFLDAYHRAHGGAEPALPEIPAEVTYRPVEGVRRPCTPELAAWFDRIVGEAIPVEVIGNKPRVAVPDGRFAIGGLRISVGGGIHTADEPRVYYATRRKRLVSVDVASFYPTLIAAKGNSLAGHGETAAATYRDILRRRLEIKQQAKEAADPAERERLSIQEAGLRLILNSAFVKLGSRFSTLFDPEAMTTVAISGQLMMIDLIERLTEAGIEVISANTDGLFLRPGRHDDGWREILVAWQADTGMTLEVESLKRLAIVATNNYATLDARGRIMRHGASLKGSFRPDQAPDALVINDAVAEALLRDIPPERTIRGRTDLARFCRITRR